MESAMWHVARQPVELRVEVSPVPLARVRLVARTIEQREQAVGDNDAGDRTETSRVIARADRSEPDDDRQIRERPGESIDRRCECVRIEHRLRLYEQRTRCMLASEPVGLVVGVWRERRPCGTHA